MLRVGEKLILTVFYKSPKVEKDETLDFLQKHMLKV